MQRDTQNGMSFYWLYQQKSLCIRYPGPRPDNTHSNMSTASPLLTYNNTNNDCNQKYNTPIMPADQTEKIKRGYYQCCDLASCNMQMESRKSLLEYVNMMIHNKCPHPTMDGHQSKCVCIYDKIENLENDKWKCLYIIYVTFCRTYEYGASIDKLQQRAQHIAYDKKTKQPNEYLKFVKYIAPIISPNNSEDIIDSLKNVVDTLQHYSSPNVVRQESTSNSTVINNDIHSGKFIGNSDINKIIQVKAGISGKQNNQIQGSDSDSKLNSNCHEGGENAEESESNNKRKKKCRCFNKKKCRKTSIKYSSYDEGKEEEDPSSVRNVSSSSRQPQQVPVQQHNAEEAPNCGDEDINDDDDVAGDDGGNGRQKNDVEKAAKHKTIIFIKKHRHSDKIIHLEPHVIIDDNYSDKRVIDLNTYFIEKQQHQKQQSSPIRPPPKPTTFTVVSSPSPALKNIIFEYTPSPIIPGSEVEMLYKIVDHLIQWLQYPEKFTKFIQGLITCPNIDKMMNLYKAKSLYDHSLFELKQDAPEALKNLVMFAHRKRSFHLYSINNSIFEQVIKQSDKVVAKFVKAFPKDLDGFEHIQIIPVTDIIDCSIVYSLYPYNAKLMFSRYNHFLNIIQTYPYEKDQCIHAKTREVFMAIKTLEDQNTKKLNDCFGHFFHE